MSSSSLGDLAYDASHCVVVCRRYQSCLVPGGMSVERHLRGAPHHLVGEELKALVAYATALELRDVSALKREKPREPVAPLARMLAPAAGAATAPSRWETCLLSLRAMRQPQSERLLTEVATRASRTSTPGCQRCPGCNAQAS